MSKDNALSFVGQIMTAYKAVMKAEGSALEHAIECGKYLALAKENVEAAKPKRKWSAWLQEHCRDIHRNTAALYMRLAENEDKIAKCTSIRQADELLRALNSSNSDSESKSAESAGSHDDEADDDDEVAQRVVQAGSRADLADLLQALAVDEVCTALIDAWDEEHIRQLCDRLRDHFTKPKDDLSILPAIRRTAPAPQPN